jgi:alanyl-tRNA synthetase
MKTERLYYTDSYVQSFAAQIVARSTYRGRPAVALDRSAFYPEGGGQPADRGSIDAVAVLDVQAEDDVIWHVLAEDVALPEQVHCRLDWQRRFDHMQQHHGQHLLTAAFLALGGPATTSFHLGESNATIDLDTPELAAELVAAAEDLANQVIWEDRPVIARFVTVEELATLPLRKPPTVSGPVRVVSVADFDYSACGGTHPHSTGGVGLVAVRRWSRQKRSTRLEFLCGGRALRDYRALNAAATRSASYLSVGRDELEAAVERMQTANDTLRKEAGDLQSQLCLYEARALYEAAQQRGAVRLVVHRQDGENPERLRELGRRIAEQAGGVAVLASVVGERAHLLVTCAADSGLDAHKLLQTGIAVIGGRGGGSSHMAQGGGANLPALSAALAAMGDAVDLQLQAGE